MFVTDMSFNNSYIDKKVLIELSRAVVCQEELNDTNNYNWEWQWVGYLVYISFSLTKHIIYISKVKKKKQ